MNRKISLLFLAFLMVFSPITNVFAQENAKDQNEIENTDELRDESASDSDETEDTEETTDEEKQDNEKDSEEELNSDEKLEEEKEDNEDKEVNGEQSDENTDSSEKVEEDEEKKFEKKKVSHYSTSSGLLKNGMRDQRIATLKKDLEKIGFPVPGNGTTYFGKDTEQKVKEFQAYYSLTADGIVGSSTVDKIDSIINSPLQNGKRHDDTITLKANLELVGLTVPGNGTRLFGKETEKKLREFQKSHGLVVNGIADEVTLFKLDELAVPVLQSGVRHKDVVQLKKDLGKLGFPVPGKETTYFGKDTKKKLQEFQTYYGLSVDGIAGQKTLAKIDSIVNFPLQKGKRHKDTIQLKQDLAVVGFKVPGKGTNLFGKETEKVVKEFQKSNGLVVNGIADEVTLAKIQEKQSNRLQNGVRHPDVVVLKEKLGKIGFPVPGKGTNLFGSDTEKVVKQFQKYYKLTVNGVADTTTLKKLDEVFNSPYQSGKRHPNTPQLKTDLGLIGFPVPGDGTTYYGKGTKETVSAFQNKYGLVVNGIADEITMGKIQSLVPQMNVTLRNGDKRPEVITLKRNLEKVGFKVPGNGTQLFGDKTESKVREFQSYYGLDADGIVGKKTYEKIATILASPLQEGISHKDTIQLKKDLAELGYRVPGNGTALYGSKTTSKVRSFQKNYGLIVNGIADEVTLAKIQELLSNSIKESTYNLSLNKALEIQKKASPQTDKNYDTYVSKSYINSKGVVTASTLNVRGGPSTKEWVVGTLTKGDKVTVLGEANGWYQIDFTKNRQWVNPSSADIKYYLDPRNFVKSERQKLQFLDLSKSMGTSKSELNKFLAGKGQLAGQAGAFIEAAKKHNVNEAYLISHSLLETGNGGSKLAQGVKYKGKTVYNMYGIGAYDSCPVDCGAKHAYEQGWTTPEKSIVGGAEFIGRNYIHSSSGQNTLYKMRWDPRSMETTGRFGRQYATDIGWASKQTTMLYQIYKDLDSYVLHLDIPVYK